MLHTEHRNTLATLKGARPLNDYLKERNADTKEEYKTFLRVWAQENVGSGKTIDGVSAAAMELIGAHKGAELSTIVVIESEEERATFLADIQKVVGEKVAFSVYTIAVADLLETAGKSGAAIEKTENGVLTRYAKLRQVYFGADDGERAEDATTKLKNDFAALLASGFAAVAE